ncbi:MAG: nucleoside-diphosphate kinase [Candidatus Margulisbacteria bacterium]|nr:nucleoside-diphosphate kinase [Candidatus Margulisiibacteriota bacterium]
MQSNTKEQTLVLIKPDAVQRRLIGEIIARFEKKGLDIIKLQMMTVNREMAEKHYAEHKGKPFYDRLINFITSAPLVAMVVEGERAINIVRKMCGATDSAVAEPGTIRGDYSISNSLNIVHSSDSSTSAEREIGIFFS